MTTATATPTFDYQTTAVRDVKVIRRQNAQTGRNEIAAISVNDEEHKPTRRFWDSLFARFGFGESMFKYFSHDEVFNRISEKEPNDRMRITIERQNGKGSLLAVSDPKKPLVNYTELTEMIGQYGSEQHSYYNGMVETRHKPRVAGGSFAIGGDTFENRFVMNIPIDGYGMPATYLALIRLICTNGAVAMTKMFKTTMALGKGDDNVLFAISRNLEGFNSDEGYAALRARVESAQHSWASVYEYDQLYRLLLRSHNANELQYDGSLGGSTVTRYLAQAGNGLFANIAATEDAARSEREQSNPVLTAFHRMAGDPMATLGIANLDALSVKRQRNLPVECTVYDLINFATEVGTHHASDHGKRRIGGYFGQLVGSEYDMEGTRDQFGDFSDFQLTKRVETGITGSARVDDRLNAGLNN